MQRSNDASSDLAAERVLIIDFGSQFTQLIARRVRESGVYCEIWPYNADPERIAAYAASAIILSGGPASVIEESSPRVPEAVFAAGVPVLGICYGEQAMCAALGGAVEAGHGREYGRATFQLTEPSPLFAGAWELGACADVWMSHGDRVSRVPPGFRTIGTSANAPFAAIADEARHYYGLMFHPEVVH
ncbi:MAG: glutamine-hydrolyzing GMP synthase, partial [Acetobacteraceae bacterium]